MTPAPAGPTVPYVALLRGINVGGRNKVPMADLRRGLEARGLAGVRTYIASGNVIAGAPDAAGSRERVADLVSATVAEDFGLECSVLVLPGRQVEQIAATIPADWDNDVTRKADVLYLFDDVDSPDTLAQLPLVPGIDAAHYTPGAIVWTVARDLRNRSGLPRIVGSGLYPRVTIRNVRTARTLADLVAGRA